MRRVVPIGRTPVGTTVLEDVLRAHPSVGTRLVRLVALEAHFNQETAATTAIFTVRLGDVRLDGDILLEDNAVIWTVSIDQQPIMWVPVQANIAPRRPAGLVANVVVAASAGNEGAFTWLAHVELAEPTC